MPLRLAEGWPVQRTVHLLKLRGSSSDGDSLYTRLGDRDDPAWMLAGEVRQVCTAVGLSDEHPSDFAAACEAYLGWEGVLAHHEPPNDEIDECGRQGADHHRVRDAVLRDAARYHARRDRRRDDQQSQRDEKLAGELRDGN